MTERQAITEPTFNWHLIDSTTGKIVTTGKGMTKRQASAWRMRWNRKEAGRYSVEIAPTFKFGGVTGEMERYGC